MTDSQWFHLQICALHMVSEWDPVWEKKKKAASGKHGIYSKLNQKRTTLLSIYHTKEQWFDRQ